MIENQKKKSYESSGNEITDFLNIKTGSDSIHKVYDFNYLGVIIIKYGQSKNDIKSTLTQAKTAFYLKNNVLISNTVLGARKRSLKLYGCTLL